jgi:hypothetical protein
MTFRWEHEGSISGRGRLVNAKTGEAVDVECYLNVYQEYVQERDISFKRERRITGYINPVPNWDLGSLHDLYLEDGTKIPCSLSNGNGAVICEDQISS